MSAPAAPISAEGIETQIVLRESGKSIELPELQNMFLAT